jgi:U6 snRNA-associated Sm-like protein LSm7
MSESSPAPKSAAKGPGGPPKKESMLELSKLVDCTVRVKCIGGREIKGILRGYDDLVNLVLDESEEFLRDHENQDRVTKRSRKLGLCVVRGTQVSLISPEDGVEEIANPFVTHEDAE